MNYDEYLDFAKELAYKAGEVMLEHFQVGVPAELKPEAGNTPVTIADTTINDMVINEIEKAYPDHTVHGEEASAIKREAPFIWVCDPIDGTLMYSAGVPTNVFALALVDATDGQPVVAVVYDPYMQRLYSAVKGQGAYMNDTKIHVNAIDDITQAYVATSSKRSVVVDSHAFKSEIVEKSFRQLAFGSCIYESMLVASGQIAATIFVGAGAYDAVTSKLIVEEAGGRVTDLYGNEQRYDQKIHGAISTNGLLHEELLAMAKKYYLTK